MAKQSRLTLKAYFETGDAPTESQFGDLIDSFAISLSELNDVNLAGLTNGFILAFDQATNKWIVRSLPIPIDELGELSNVDLTGLSNQSVLSFDQPTSKWIPRIITIPTIPIILAGDGLTKSGDIIAMGLPGTLSKETVNAVGSETHTHFIDGTIARTERSIIAGEGLFGGGDLSEDRTLSLEEHDHQTVGGKLDHGLALDGLSDDDHPQYWDDIRGATKIDQHSSADDHLQYWNDARGNPKVDTKITDHNNIKTAHGLVIPSAVNDFMIASGIGTWTKKTLSEAKTILGVLNESDILAITNPLFAPVSHVGSTGAAHGPATTSVNGFMSAPDKTKLDGLNSANYAPVGHVGSGGDSHADVTTSVDGFMKAEDKTKLDGLNADNYAPIAHVGSRGSSHDIVTTGINGFMIATDKSKLDGLNSANYAPIAHVGSTGSAHGNATTGVAGFMSAADKTKVDGLSMQLIQTIILSSAGTITFSNIPQTFRHLKIIGRARSPRAAFYDTMAVRFNNDSSVNYRSQYANLRPSGFASSIVTGDRLGTTLIEGGNAFAGAFSPVDILFADYRGANLKEYFGMGFTVGDASDPILQIRGSIWHNTSAISTIYCFTEVSTNFVAGTSLSLYGILG